MREGEGMRKGWAQGMVRDKDKACLGTGSSGRDKHKGMIKDRVMARSARWRSGIVFESVATVALKTRREDSACEGSTCDDATCEGSTCEDATCALAFSPLHNSSIGRIWLLFWAGLIP